MKKMGILKLYQKSGNLTIAVTTYNIISFSTDVEILPVGPGVDFSVYGMVVDRFSNLFCIFSVLEMCFFLCENI